MGIGSRASRVRLVKVKSRDISWVDEERISPVSPFASYCRTAKSKP